MPQPSFAIAVTFVIKPDCVERFRTRVLQQAADSLQKEPGCCQFDVLSDESKSNVFFLYETYVDAAAFDEHRATAHFADFGQAVSEWVESKLLCRLNILENPRA